jgi:hypothetical protein
MSLILPTLSEDAKALSAKLGTGSFLTESDLQREIGSTLSTNQFQRRIQALTDPKEYQKDLITRMKEVESRASDVYKQSYEQYYTSGLAPEMAKSLALQSARSTYEMFMNAVRIEFPESSTGIYSIGAKQDAFNQSGSQPTPFSVMNPSDIVGGRR